ncbi:unnamed protein product [Brachionus calyciflorus]|uniref:MULE transposase domain-containing protein n=1 Tax=Brachionus calyciflorus TaxID=104777 RepID=A0A814DPP0_9BILA|nr:unnamed protein product [Brachionus calyciflorus]
MFVCVYILLINITTDLYVKAFTNLKKAWDEKGIILNPKTVMSDYEPEAINAVKEVFPEARTQGCYFHYIQSIRKNIQNKMLTNKYKNNVETRKWFDKLKALAFLPKDYINFAYSNIKSIRPFSSNSQNYEKFIIYFEQTWLFGHYKLESWNQFENVGPRTKNTVEAHNRKIKNELLQKHPNIYQFIVYIKLVETEKAVNYLDKKIQPFY